MMNNLFRFLTDIAVNPKQQLAFANSADAVMAAAELSETERAIVDSKSSFRVAEVFAGEQTQLALVCGDPGPDPTPDPDSVPDDDD